MFLPFSFKVYSEFYSASGKANFIMNCFVTGQGKLNEGITWCRQRQGVVAFGNDVIGILGQQAGFGPVLSDIFFDNGKLPAGGSGFGYIIIITFDYLLKGQGLGFELIEAFGLEFLKPVAKLQGSRILRPPNLG